MNKTLHHSIDFHMNLLSDAFRYQEIYQQEGTQKIGGAEEVIFDIADQLRNVLKLARHDAKGKGRQWDHFALGLLHDAIAFTPQERWTRPMVVALQIAWQTWNISEAGDLPDCSNPPIELSALRVTLRKAGWTLIPEPKEESA